MKQFMGKIGDGWERRNWTRIPGVSFQEADEDLSLAIHDGEMYGKGKVCRSKRTGRLHVEELTIKVADDYNFHKLPLNFEMGLKKLALNMANNFVYAAQEHGLVKQYHWYAIFEETRTSF